MSVLPDNQGQIDCAKCKKPFRGNLLAERIRCPLCHHVNIINAKQYPSYVLLEVPHPSLPEVKTVVENILKEDVTGDGWEQVGTTYEHISSLNGRHYCVGDNGNEVWVGVAESVVVPGKIEEIFNVFWDLSEELKWNTTSLKSNTIIEQSGNEQVVYQERKTHASISIPADVLYRRTFEKWDNFIIAWGKPEVSAKKAPKQGFRRCEIVFLGFQVTKVDNDNCQVAMTSAFHELGNVPSLVIQDELKKISLRVSKVITRAQDLRRLASRGNPQPSIGYNSNVVQQEAVSKPSATKVTGNAGLLCCGQVSAGLFCGNCGKKLR
jgi:LSD1 subclass zinc finger protein